QFPSDRLICALTENIAWTGFKEFESPKKRLSGKHLTIGALQESDLMLANQGCPKFAARQRQLGEKTDQLEVARLRTSLTQSAISQARQKLADAEQNNERASAALIKALAGTKAMIDAANQRTQHTETADLLINLLTEEEVEKVRQNAADYAQRLLADFDAAR